LPVPLSFAFLLHLHPPSHPIVLHLPVTSFNMQTTFALVALATTVYAATTCSPNYTGQFQIAPQNLTTASSKRSIQERAICPTATGTLLITLQNGVLTDSAKRTGAIVANHQFQFDNPLQTNSLFTSGFSACSNGSLASQGNAVFYKCLSGSFFNLYDQSLGAHCSPVTLEILPCGTGSGAVVSQIPDGQIQATTGVPPATQIADGQIQLPTGNPISQIPDGQIQAPTGSPTRAPITQISDGQIQAPTGTSVRAPVTQISDGQIQAPTSLSPVTQISDGQIQAPTKVPTLVTATLVSQTPAKNSTATSKTSSPSQLPVSAGHSVSTLISVYAAITVAMVAALL
jgi:hypothetical protein